MTATTLTNMELQNWQNTPTSAPPPPPPPPAAAAAVADDPPPSYQRFVNWTLPPPPGPPGPDTSPPPPQRYSNLHMVVRFLLGIYEAVLVFRFGTGTGRWIAGEQSRRDGHLNQDVAILFGVSFSSSSNSQHEFF